METSHSAKRHAGIGAVRSEDRPAGDRLGLRQARSAHADQEPGHVRARGRHDLDHGHPGPRPRHGRRTISASKFQIILWLWFTVLFANFAEAVAEGRGKAQADTLRRQRTETQAKLLAGAGRRTTGWCRHEPQGRRRRAGRGRRHHPLRRRGGRRRGLGQRGGDHRRIGAGHPRIRRRPLRRDRRHAGAVRLDPRAHHRGAGLDLPRPHDRAGRGRRAAEDAERDRAQHPARSASPSSSCSPRRRSRATRPMRAADLGRRPGGAVRDPDPDHDRRAAVGHRHRRHGPAGALQRARHVGPRRRGGGRRRYAAARQDRHDHARQPPGHRVQAAARRERAGTRRRGAACLARRRDPGGPLHRGARQGEIRHPRPRPGRAATPTSFRSRRRPA